MVDISLYEAPFIYRCARKSPAISVSVIQESGNGGRYDKEDDEDDDKPPVRGGISDDFVLVGRDILAFPANRDSLAIPLLGHR